MSDFSLEELKLAFGYHFVRLVLETDMKITRSETEFIEEVFPRSDMDMVGFMDSSGAFTSKHAAALTAARDELPGAIELKEKLAFLTTLLRATLSDGQFDREEFEVLEVAARMLGVPNDALEAHLDKLDEVGSVDLPEPEVG